MPSKWPATIYQSRFCNQSTSVFVQTHTCSREPQIGKIWKLRDFASLFNSSSPLLTIFLLTLPLCRRGAHFNLKAHICGSNASSKWVDLILRNRAGAQEVFKREAGREVVSGKNKKETKKEQKGNKKKRNDFVTSAHIFPSEAESVLAHPRARKAGKKRGRKGTEEQLNRQELDMFIHAVKQLSDIGEGFKAEDGFTSCMAFSSG